MIIKYIKYYLISLILLLISISGFTQKYTAQELKAVYLLSIPSFVKFPNTSEKDAITIGIYGKDPFGQLLGMMLTAKKGAKCYLFHFKSLDELENADYNILFISDVNKSELLKIFELTRNKAILTIGNDLPEFCELGGIINFQKLTSEKIFQVNLSELAKKHIIVDPKLLVLSKIINN